MKYLYLLIFILAIFIRTYGLTTVPPSLYWEEAALGYDAYSIAQTGKDHHGTTLPIVAFESFGDWKPSGYFYILVPFVSIFGLNEWAVRLPTVLAGLALIIGTACVARKLGVSSLTALFVGALSPWAIQFSRAGWEVMSASAFVVWANFLLLKAFEKRKIEVLPAVGAVFLFAAAMYTYHATRLIVPLQLMGLILYFIFQHTQLVFRKGLSKVPESSKKYSFLNRLIMLLTENSKKIILLAVIFIVLTAPLLLSLGTKATNQRFQETSIFSNLEVIEQSNALKEQSGNTIFARLVYHRYVLFAQLILTNFFSHFTLDFLFLHGDSNLRHSLQFFGQLYYIEIVFLAVGVYLWIKQRKLLQLYLLYWLFTAVLPASLTNATPHALRILPGLPVFIILIATGIERVCEFLKGFVSEIYAVLHMKRFQEWTQHKAVAIILFLYLLEFIGFWRYYQTVYLKVASSEWQYGYKEMVKTIIDLQAAHPETPIYITREYGRPAMYYWFYSKTDPREVQAANATAPKDQGEFLQYKNVYFIDRLDQVKTVGIVASSPDFYQQAVASKSVEDIVQVTNLESAVVWKIYSVK